MDVCLSGLNRHSCLSGAATKRTSSAAQLHHKHTFIWLFVSVIWGPHIITLAGREPSGFVGNPHWFFCLLRLSMAAFLWLHHRIDDKDTSTRWNRIGGVSRGASAFVRSLRFGSEWERMGPVISEGLLDIWAYAVLTARPTHTRPTR